MTSRHYPRTGQWFSAILLCFSLAFTPFCDSAMLRPFCTVCRLVWVLMWHLFSVAVPVKSSMYYIIGADQYMRTHDRATSMLRVILVTGVIKCRSWSVAAISNYSGSNSRKVALSPILRVAHSWLLTLGNNHMPQRAIDRAVQIQLRCIFCRIVL